jgi:hypothetical protein
MAVGGNGAFVSADVGIQSSEHRIVSKQVGVGSGVRSIINSNDLNVAVLTQQPTPHKVPPNAPKPVDRYSNHCVLSSLKISYNVSLGGPHNHIL